MEQALVLQMTDLTSNGAKAASLRDLTWELEVFCLHHKAMGSKVASESTVVKGIEQLECLHKDCRVGFHSLLELRGPHEISCRIKMTTWCQ